jgi:hypothetical protein
VVFVRNKYVNIMHMKSFTILFIIVLALGLGSCKKASDLPAIPRIEFNSFSVFDTVDILGNSAKGGRLKFYFEDGDGDLGDKSPDGQSTDTTNLFFTLYRKTGGVMIPAPDNDPLKPSSYRIPYMERLGQNKILKGTISVTFIYLFYSVKDTIRYDFYVKDRSRHESNVDSTSEIVLSVNRIYKK